jgi:hypothetical protein
MYSCGWVGFINKLLGSELVTFVKSLTRRGKAKHSQVRAAGLGEISKMAALCLNIVYKRPVALTYLLYIYIYIRLKCNLFSCPISLTLHVSNVQIT